MPNPLSTEGYQFSQLSYDPISACIDWGGAVVYPSPGELEEPPVWSTIINPDLI